MPTLVAIFRLAGVLAALLVASFRLADVVAALLVAILITSCVPAAGDRPDSGMCRPSPHFFASDIYPRYLDFNGCGRNGCHGVTVGSGYFRLAYVLDAPLAEPDVTRWPAGWRANYESATQLLRCDAPTESRLLATPAGLADPHPAGNTVSNLAEAQDLFRRWVTLP